MGAISPTHLLLVLIVALIVIGPSRLPETGAALGKALKQFRDAAAGLDPDETATPAAPPTTPTATVMPPAALTTAAPTETTPIAATQAAVAPTAIAPAAPAPDEPDSTTPQA